MEFNEKLRLLRREAGLTQRQVADAVGVTYRTYQNYEAGASRPSGGVAMRLAAALGVSTDTLLGTRQASDAAAAADAELCALQNEMQALFAGGVLREADKKYVLDALTEAYFRTKEHRKHKKENHHG